MSNNHPSDEKNSRWYFRARRVADTKSMGEMKRSLTSPGVTRRSGHFSIADLQVAGRNH